jgi:hypothetical protein
MATGAPAQPLSRHTPTVTPQSVTAAILIAAAALLVVLAIVALVTGVVPADRVPSLVASPQLIGHALIATAILLALIGTIRDAEGYMAGVWVVSTLGPWIAASTAVVTYLVSDGANRPIEVKFAAAYNGIAAALAFIAAIAFLGRQLSRPQRAQPRTWEGLVDRLAQLKARINATFPTPEEGAPTTAAERHARALGDEARALLVTVDEHICHEDRWRPELRWALATGYSSVQRTLHRLDEMLIEAEPTAALTGDALHDALCLSGSTMTDREALMARLRAAIQVISPQAYRYFFPVGGAPSAGEPAEGATPSEAEARGVLREVRYAINTFRDDRVDGLIRARNRLVWVVLTVGITAYLALGLAIIRGASLTAVATVSVLYLVAALAGLVNRLRIESSRSSAIEDFGLHFARLIATPLLSGLAGVAGVYLVAMTPELLMITSPSTAAAGQEVSTVAPLALGQIFDLATNQSALLVAAVFGLVPAQLFSGLQRQADRFQVDLEKSAPAGESTLNTGVT